MKYIDAEKLITEIERRLKRYDPDYTNAGSELKELLSIITSLQQEHPEFPTTDEEVEKALSTIPEAELPDKYKTPDWLFEKQEQPEVDLEKLGEIARHLIAVKDHEEDMRLDEGEWLLLERIGHPERFNARKGE